MKVAVYSIAKNEENFVQRWIDSCREADSIVLLDTGSTDDTTQVAVDALRDHPGQNVVAIEEFTPWRFDTARNRALSLVPHDIDICISLDLDEILTPGWRQALERIDRSVTRPRYKYVWSWNPDGSEGLVYGGDKIHHRHNYTWKHPVHEVIKRDPDASPEVQGWVEGLQIHHHPDSTKSRGQYFPLLEMAVEESPDDDRNVFYLAREYFFHRRFDDADRMFRRHLELSRWGAERAASHRFLAQIHHTDAEAHLYRAIAESPMRRESWVSLALHYYGAKAWLECRFAAEMALRVTEKPLDYLCETYAWGSMPYDLAAVACHHLGDSDAAFAYGAEAVAREPDDERLRTNMEFYRTP